MINVIVELSKYLILVLMILYTLQCFNMFRIKDAQDRRHLLAKQVMLMFFMDLTAFTVIYLNTLDFRVIQYYLAITVFFAVLQILYRLLYKKASLLLINNMCMLLSVGFIILCRLDMTKAVRQFVIVAAGSAIALIVPILIRKMRFLRKLTWVYAGIGIFLLGVVLVMGMTTYGAKLSIMGVQPSEIVKITFALFPGGAFAKGYLVQKCGDRNGHSRGSRLDFGSVQRPRQRACVLCRISGDGICGHKKSWVPGPGAFGRKRRLRRGLLPVRACAPEGGGLERSHVRLRSGRIPDCAVAFRDWHRRLVWDGPVPRGLEGRASGSRGGFCLCSHL